MEWKGCRTPGDNLQSLKALDLFIPTHFHLRGTRRILVATSLIKGSSASEALKTAIFMAVLLIPKGKSLYTPLLKIYLLRTIELKNGTYGSEK